MTGNSSTVSVGDITQADLNVNEAAREQALQAFMQGNPFGAPPRQDQIGLSSQNPDELLNRPAPPNPAQLAAESEARLTELLAPVADNAVLARELADWQKKYGDRENEFGALRREKQELEETLQLLLSQQQAPQGNFSQPYTAQPGYSQPYSPVPNGDPFEGVDDTEYMSGAQVKRIVGGFIAPALAASWQKAEAAEKALTAVRAQSFADSKRSAGISALDELRLKSKFPALAAMPDGAEKVSIMKTLLGPKEPTPAQTQPIQNVIAQNAARNVVGRVTHIEGSTGASGEPPTNPNAAFQAEMAAAERLPFHLRSVAMDKVLQKYKVPTVNTFGVGRYRV